MGPVQQNKGAKECTTLIIEWKVYLIGKRITTIRTRLTQAFTYLSMSRGATTSLVHTKAKGLVNTEISHIS